MGFLDDLFGDEKERRQAMERAFAQYKQDMSQYLNQFESRMLGTIEDVRAAEEIDTAALSEDFANQIASFDALVMGSLTEGFDAAQAKMDEGFSVEQEDIRIAAQDAELRSVAQSALTGVGATSFGQSQIQAVRTEGQRELRRSEEKYRMANIELLLNRASTMGAAGSQRVGIMGQQAGAMSDLRRAYTSSITGLSSSIAQGMLQGQSQIAQAGYETGMGVAQNIGSGFNLGGALLGAGLSLATAGIGGAMGIPMFQTPTAG
tara:strand:+ start:2081 stop:2866 length:786 start_codon:yes stop_codon:yes gene_type:complete